MTADTFSPQELTTAVAAALLVQFGAVMMMMFAHNELKIDPEAEKQSKPVPIAVKPVIDMAPLLKLGGKKVKAKLPDMWVKQQPKKRFKAASAPSPDAEKTPEAIPTSDLAEWEAGAPPPDADIAKEVDEDIEQMDASPDSQTPNVDDEGHEDGVKEGTEPDPLKARAVSLYRAKIIGWFSSRFRVPSGEIPCDQLQGLSAAVAANVGPGRTVTGFSITRPSGNGTFDGRVQSTMQSVVGQQLPPPPPNYPDILDSTVYPTFLGKGQKCE